MATHKYARKLAYPLGLLLWAGVAVLVLEVYGAWRLKADDAAGRAWPPGQRPGATPELDEAVVAKYVGELPPLGADIEARMAFAGLTEAERETFADNRHQLVAWCDENGTVHRTYVDEAHPRLTRLAKDMSLDAPVWAALDDELADDAQTAFRQALTSGHFVVREYPVEQDYIAQTHFVPFANFPDGPRVAVFMRDSIWETLWQRFRPNAFVNDFDRIRTNAQGWRDDPVALPKPEGMVRIVCIGGSTTVEGPANALTYPNLLEVMLRRHFETDQIEVVNAGVFGHTLPTQNKIITDYLALEPDLIVHYNYVNDLIQYLPQWIGPGAPHANLATWLKYLVRHSRFVYYFANRAILPNRTLLRLYLDEFIVLQLRRLQDELEAAGVPLAICSFAYPDAAALSTEERVYFDHHIHNMQWGRIIDIASYGWITAEFNELVENLCEEQGIDYIPVAEAFDGAGGAVFTDICHMSPHGMELKARAVFEDLRPWVEAQLQQVP